MHLETFLILACSMLSGRQSPKALPNVQGPQVGPVFPRFPRLLLFITHRARTKAKGQGVQPLTSQMRKPRSDFSRMSFGNILWDEDLSPKHLNPQHMESSCPSGMQRTSSAHNCNSLMDSLQRHPLMVTMCLVMCKAQGK